MMIYLKINEILKEKIGQNTGLWRIWNGGYQSLSNLMNNETSGIHFDTLEKLCSVLECDPGDIIILKKGKRRKKRNEQIT